ncbi:hypothetical protein [Bdellovibrio sp. HCB337]|uniref:hypothetical protein n=1 Tax=Bdellovibrio sp. HCB337 TaxID=3394358 RepID=UPI0039A6481A
MKSLIVLALGLLVSAGAQALDLRKVDHLSCSSDSRGTFNLVDLQSSPRFVQSRSHDLEVLDTSKLSISYVHPNGTETRLELSASPRKNYEGETYESILSEDTGMSQSLICAVVK